LFLPLAVRNGINELSVNSLRTLAQRALSDGDAVVDELAKQFLTIEKAEQKCLMGVMNHHAAAA
jgi:hypothetical protein